MSKPRYFETSECPECNGSGLGPDGQQHCVCCGGLGEVSREFFPAATEWKPIREAPKIDGERILLWEGDWYEGQWLSGSGAGWYDAEAKRLNPTHFAPVNPVNPPPEENDAKEEDKP